jgi:hypothetical protein
VVLDANGICYSLTVGQGVNGQFTFGNNGTNRTLTVSKDVRILTGATMTTGVVAATHSMSMGGNLTNNGTLNLAPAGTKVCNVTFNNNGNQTISGAGATTNFNLITLNMGTSNANVLEVASTNFTVLPANFLTVTNGTLKISTATAALTPFTGAATIPVTGGVWLNNAGTTISTGATVTLYGYLRVSAGTLNIGNASDENLTSYGGTITIDGGTVNIAGRLDRAGVTILTFFNMTSGTLKVGTVGSSTAGLAPFMISETGSTFNMSGGTIIIERPGAGNLGYLNTGGTFGSVTGGTVQMGDASTPVAQTMQINSSVPVYNLVASNGVAVTSQLSINSLTVKNNVTINSGALNANTLNVAIGGNWTNSGTFTPGTGAVTFNGTAAQTIDGSTATTFNNLIINNSLGSAGGVMLNLAPAASTIVSGALTLTSGKIITTSTNFLTLTNVATSSSGSAASFVDGPMTKQSIPNGGSFIFPVGKGTRWRRMAITAVAGGASNFTAEYFNTGYGSYGVNAPLNNVSTIEYWTVTKAAGATAAKATLYWEDATASGITDCPDLTLAHWNGATWDEYAGTASGTCTGAGTGSVLMNSTSTSFSPVTFGSKSGTVNPLPVEFLSFNAEPSGSVVDVTWSTAVEMNTDYFMVQHSKDGINFQNVVQVDAAGNSSTVKNYSTVDPDPYPGISYYRLKQVDNDGKFAYSEMMAVNFSGGNAMTVYPSPSSGNFNVSISGEKGKAVLLIVRDALGREFYSKVLLLDNDDFTQAIDLSGKIPSGIYMVTASSDDRVLEKKIVIR